MKPISDWRPVLRTGGKLEVNEYGDIRNYKSGCLLAKYPNNCGYARIFTRINKKQIGLLVHRVVAEVFIGPCPDGYQVNHKNGDKYDNRSENLEYVTPSKNISHSFDLGLSKPMLGERNGSSKLTENQVREIREMRMKTGFGAIKLSRLLGISRSTIEDIITGTSWSWLS